MARVLFLQNVWTENLGPMYLSASAKRAGHHCDLLIETKSGSNSEIKKFKPDIVAFSVMTGSHGWALQKATEIKKELGIPIIMGGPHATYYPEVIEHASIDIVCRGECEDAFVDVLNLLDSGIQPLKVKNVWIKNGEDVIRNDVRELVENLDMLARPDRHLYYKYPFFKNHENKSFVSGRGCPFSCTYCSIAGLRDLYMGKGSFVRFFSPERVVSEIEEIRDKYGLKVVIFQDDTFIIGLERLGLLLDLYAQKIGLPYVCHVRADLMTPEIAQLLKETGCHSVDFGLESGDEALRTTMLGKPITNEHIRRTAKTLHRAGIKFRTTNMFGLPGESLHQAFKTIRLNQDIRTDYPSASVYQPYPRTKLGDLVIQKNLVPDNYSVDSIGSTFFRASLLKSEHLNEFVNLQKFFWPAVRYPWLMSIIKKLIKLPPNPIFEFIFLFFYAVNYMQSEMVTARRVINLGLRTAGGVFFGKK